MNKISIYLLTAILVIGMTINARAYSEGPGLELLGTAIGNIKDPIAFIKDLDADKQGIYKLGSKIKDAKVVKIEMGVVVLERNGKKETLKLSKRARNWASAGDNPAIISMSEGEIVLSRNEMRNQRENIVNTITGIKVRPFSEGNKVVGLRVEGIAKDNIIAAAGIRNKDIVKMINGQVINSYQKALEVVSKLRNRSEIRLSLVRDGEAKDLNYRIAQ